MPGNYQGAYACKPIPNHCFCLFGLRFGCLVATANTTGAKGAICRRFTVQTRPVNENHRAKSWLAGRAFRNQDSPK